MARKEKFFLGMFAFCLAILVVASQPIFAEPRDVRVDLGADENKLRWYMVKVDELDSMPLTTVRVYYAAAAGKKQMVEALVAEAGLEEAKAQTLYFSEYDYVFNSAEKKYAIKAARHYDTGGNHLFGADVSFEELQWMDSTKGSIPSKALEAYTKL